MPNIIIKKSEDIHRLNLFAIANLFLTGGSDRILPKCFFDPEILHDSVWITAVAGALDFISNDVPFYWLNKDLIKALLSTELPSSVGSFSIPFNRAMFVLPTNLIVTPDKLPLEWLYFRFLPKDFLQQSIPISDHWGELHFIDSEPQSVDKIVWTAVVKGLIYKGIQEINNGEITRGNLTIIEYHDYLNLPPSNPETEQRFCKMIDDLVVKVLLYLQISGAKVEASFNYSTSSTKSKSNLPLTPTWIGKNYQSTNSQISKKYLSTHASPRPHFRTGHMKRVAIGPGRSDRAAPRRDRKWVWIEPTLVNWS